VRARNQKKGVKVKPWKMEEFEQRQEKRERKHENEIMPEGGYETQTDKGWE
jgi:hypothetical protein